VLISRNRNKDSAHYKLRCFRSHTHAKIYKYYAHRRRLRRYLVRLSRYKYAEFRSYGKLLDFIRSVRNKIKTTGKNIYRATISVVIELWNKLWQLLPEKLRNKITQYKYSLYTAFKKAFLFIKESPLMSIIFIGLSAFSIYISIKTGFAKAFFNFIYSQITSSGLHAAPINVEKIIDGIKHYYEHEILHSAAHTHIAEESQLEEATAYTVSTMIIETISRRDDVLDKESGNKEAFNLLYDLFSDIKYVAKKILSIFWKLLLFLLKLVLLYVVPIIGSIYFIFTSVWHIIQLFSYKSFFFKMFVTEDFNQIVKDDSLQKEIEEIIEKISIDIANRNPITASEIGKMLDFSCINYISSAAYASINTETKELMTKINDYIKTLNAQSDKTKIVESIADKYVDYLYNEVLSPEAIEKVHSKIKKFVSEKITDEDKRKKIAENMNKMREKYIKKYGEIDKNAVKKYIIDNTIVNVVINPDSDIAIHDIDCSLIENAFSHTKENYYDISKEMRLYALTKYGNRMIDIIKKYFSEGEIEKKEEEEIIKSLNKIEENIEEIIIEDEAKDKKQKDELTLLKQIAQKMDVLFSTNTMDLNIKNVEGFVRVPGETCKEIKYYLDVSIKMPLLLGTIIKH